MKTRFITLLVTLMAFVASATGANNDNDMAISPDSSDVKVKISTSLGDITVLLYGDTPRHRDNFIKLVKEGYYDGTLFHRVIKDFMIQGGGLGPRMDEKATRAPIKNEADNGLSNDRGTIAMARTMDPHSATAQFFINLVDNDFLNYSAPVPSGWGYCVFGKVVEGMDVVDKIAKVKTKSVGFHENVPTDMVLITGASRFE